MTPELEQALAQLQTTQNTIGTMAIVSAVLVFLALTAIIICLPLLTWRALSRSKRVATESEAALLRRELLELKSEIESWKAGDLQLWDSIYTFRIQRVQSETIDLHEEMGL